MKHLRPILLALLLITFNTTAYPQERKEEEIQVIAEGIATLNDDVAGAEEEALWEAKRNAVEQAAGLFLKAEAIGRDFQLSKEEIRTSSKGYIRHWERIMGSRTIERVGNGKLLRIKIRATVALMPVLLHIETLKEVLSDLQRPRLFVQASEALEPQRLQLRQYLEEQGFIIADAHTSSAIIVRLTGSTSPLLTLGDTKAPFELGASVGTQCARLTLELTSFASEETLLTKTQEATGSSFQSNEEAKTNAMQCALQTLLDQESQNITQTLLLRWVRERQEGYSVALTITNLPKKERESLKQAVETMRGFQEFIGESHSSDCYTLRFFTRLAVRDIRRRLTVFRHSDFALLVREESGAIIHCAAVRPRLRLPSRGEPRT